MLTFDCQLGILHTLIPLINIKILAVAFTGVSEPILKVTLGKFSLLVEVLRCTWSIYSYKIQAVTLALLSIQLVCGGFTVALMRLLTIWAIKLFEAESNVDDITDNISDKKRRIENALKRAHSRKKSLNRRITIYYIQHALTTVIFIIHGFYKGFKFTVANTDYYLFHSELIDICTIFLLFMMLFSIAELISQVAQELSARFGKNIKDSEKEYIDLLKEEAKLITRKDNEVKVDKKKTIVKKDLHDGKILEVVDKSDEEPMVGHIRRIGQRVKDIFKAFKNRLKLKKPV